MGASTVLTKWVWGKFVTLLLLGFTIYVQTALNTKRVQGKQDSCSVLQYLDAILIRLE